MSPDAERILAQLRLAGGLGVARVDFLAPDVIDGGKPIINLPGRILELREELGADAIVDTGERRNRCKVYRLAGRPGRQQLTELRCQLGHAWMGSCRRDARGYPFVAGAVPVCPVCAREACAVETFMSPAHPDVVSRAAA